MRGGGGSPPRTVSPAKPDLPDADPARGREDEVVLAGGHAELHPRGALLQLALAAGLVLVHRERSGVRRAVAGDRVAVALEPALGLLARAFLGQARVLLAARALLGRDPQGLAVVAVVGDLQRRLAGSALDLADELGLGVRVGRLLSVCGGGDSGD